MTRIIGGTAGGRRIKAPPGQQTRPTSDRVREALFSAIESWCGTLQGLRFLDLYAGSGAVGLEAWSRGAGVVTLVESDRRTARADRRERPGRWGSPRPTSSRAPVATMLARPPSAPYDIAFLDPPYDLSDEDLAAVLGQLADHELAGPGGDGRRRAVGAQPGAGRGRTASPTSGASGTARPRFGTVTPLHEPNQGEA